MVRIQTRVHKTTILGSQNTFLSVKKKLFTVYINVFPLYTGHNFRPIFFKFGTHFLLCNPLDKSVCPKILNHLPTFSEGGGGALPPKVRC